MKRSDHDRQRNRVLITGGAGFVGTNLAVRYLQDGWRVILLDNLSRPGVEANAEWLLANYRHDVQLYEADVRDELAVRSAVASVDRVYHLAAQVAVTTSLVDPRTDFEINAGGMLNVLEALRRRPRPPALLFTSTNKVYGDLEAVPLRERQSRYEPADAQLHELGVNEAQSLSFHSPYGCSKGTADQYLLDYARCFRLPGVVFRMSCIYGPHQRGTEDQGWLAHFLIRALHEQPITIYGDGKQVRDVLYVDDLTNAMFLALDRIDVTRGQKFNIGGGPDRTISLLELIGLIEENIADRVQIHFEPWRQGDQRYYVSNTRSFQQTTGWRPRVSTTTGISRLCDWLKNNMEPVTTVSQRATTRIPDPSPAAGH